MSEPTENDVLDELLRCTKVAYPDLDPPHYVVVVPMQLWEDLKDVRCVADPVSEPTEREPLTDDEIEFVERMRKNLEIMGGRSGLVGGHASWLRVVDKLRTALRAAEERERLADQRCYEMTADEEGLLDRLSAAESSLARYKTALHDIDYETVDALDYETVDALGAAENQAENETYCYGNLIHIARILNRLAALEESPEDRDQ